MLTNENCKDFNPKTMELIRNLKAMGCLSFAVHDLFQEHLMSWCFEKNLLPDKGFTQLTMHNLLDSPISLLIDFVEKKNLISFAINDLFDRYLQQWCISKGILTNDYIANISFKSLKSKADSMRKKNRNWDSGTADHFSNN